MRLNITGLEDVPIYLAIIAFTFVFSFFVSKRIFHELDILEIQYSPKLKRRSTWLIFSGLTSIIIWSRVLQQLLSLLQ